MDPFHPLASDADADPSEIAIAQASCALALGRLDGLLAGLSTQEKRLFCWTLLRKVLLSGLRQAGFDDAEAKFEQWFIGTDRAPQESALTASAAHAVVRAVLAELCHHPWEPLAEAALIISKIGRFAPDRGLSTDDANPTDALTEASKLITAASLTEQDVPFPALEQLSAQLRRSQTFAPLEREAITLPLPGKTASVTRAAMRTPLWAVDLKLGDLLASQIGLKPALPFPDAITPEALGSQLWPGERAIVLAEALRRSAQWHITAIIQARTDYQALELRVRHLRASARGPLVWLALRGFAPLGIEQLDAGFGISRRGSYAVVDALVAAGLVRKATVLGRVVLIALPPSHQIEAPGDTLSPLPSPLLAEFDAVMADVDRLLARHNG